MRLHSRTQDLRSLVNSFHPVIAIETVEEERAREMVLAVCHSTMLPLYEWSITKGLTSTDQPALPSAEDPMVLLQFIKDLKSDGVFLLKDFSQHLTTPQLIRQFRETAQKLSKTRSTIILLAPQINLPAEIEHKTLIFDLPLPDRAELKMVLKSVFEALARTNKVKFALSPQETENLIDALTGLTQKQARQILTHCCLVDGALTADDIKQILARKAELLKGGGILDYYPPDQNQFQIGGFEKLKHWLESAKVGFSKEAAALNIKPPKGILLVGVPGCGKSLAAKAIASDWSLPLLKLDAGRLFDKFIGESEKNFRRAIVTAEAMAPSILWIDEIEKSMSVTQDSSSDGGLSKRLFGAFLTWLQEKDGSVFVIATANDVSRLPPELLRKGRFDEVFFVDLPKPEERTEILALHLRIRKQDPKSLNLGQLAVETEGFSGSEL